MEITIQNHDGKATVAVRGRLDSMTSPELEGKLAGLLERLAELELDLDGLDYISSAGLRVILSAQKRMSKQGRMTVAHVRPAVMEVFEMTGFSAVLTIV